MHQTTVKVGGQLYQQDDNNLFHCHVAGCDFTCQAVPQLRNHHHVRAGWKEVPNPVPSAPAGTIMDVDDQPDSGKQAS